MFLNEPKSCCHGSFKISEAYFYNVHCSVLLYSHSMQEFFVVFVQYLVVDGFSFCMDVEMIVRSDDYCCHETTTTTTTVCLF